MFGLFSKGKNPNATPEQAAKGQKPALSPEEMDRIPVAHMAELLSVAYVSMADGNLSQTEMEALYEIGSKLTLQPAQGLQTLMSLQKLIADGGDTACAYQYKKWDAANFSIEQKRGIIEAGFMIALVDADLTAIELDALGRISRWIAMPPDEFTACLRSLADGLSKLGQRS